MTEASSPRAPLAFERLAPSHDRAAFDCGIAEMNGYLQRFARQNASRDLGVTYVGCFPEEPTRIACYFTLAASKIERRHLPADLKLPQYPLPAFLLARLAVDIRFQGRGLGYSALFKAFQVVATIAELGAVYALEVEALDDKAARFYARYGFTSCLDDALHLVLALSTVRQIILDAAP